MDNNTINNHIYQNTTRNAERGLNSRLDRETIEKVLARKCDGNACDNSIDNICNSCEIRCKNEHGGEVFVANIGKMAYRNENYRESIWTGRYLQATLMSIEKGNDIGIEMHNDTDQYIRVEYGNAIAMTGNEENSLDKKYRLCVGDVIFIPAGTWHNIVNIGRCSLKLSSVYAPTHHPRCTVERYKENH